MNPGPRQKLALGLALLGGLALGFLVAEARPKAVEYAARARSKLARARVGSDGPHKGWEAIARGVTISPHAAGLDHPTRLAFVRSPPTAPGPPLYYVAELPGTIRRVDLAGASAVVATGLLDFDWKEGLEAGLIGMCLDDTAPGLFVTLVYWDGDAGVFRNRVEHLRLSEDGTELVARTTVLDMREEATVVSYQIQFVSLGPDGHLYVGVGVGGQTASAQDLERFSGKILRLARDGSAPRDNPFYDPERPGAARSYVYALGVRNPYDIAWDPASNAAYVTDVGPGIDRIFRLERGANYAFGVGDGDESMRVHAAYTWGPGAGFAPTGITLAPAESSVAGSADFLYVGLFGSVHAGGPNEGKRIVRFPLDPNGFLAGGPTLVNQYRGLFFASVTDVEFGPDGIYFCDFYGSGGPPHRGQGLVYRMDFAPVDAEAGAAPFSGDWKALSKEELFGALGCVQCHDRGPSVMRKEGPNLQDLRSRVEARLASDEYRLHLGELGQRPGAYFRGHAASYRAILERTGEARLRSWFRTHLRDPRFDHAEAKMPAYPDLDEVLVERLADLLLR